MSNRVLVASRNHIKALATQDALHIFSNETYVVKLAETEIASRVSAQPMSLEETTRGALQRLEQIRKIPGFVLYIAIEGGAYNIKPGANKERWYESACAAVADNRGGYPSVAYGPSYPIPPKIAEHLVQGKDLNEAMEEEIGVPEIGKAEGFNGWLTEGKLDRRAGSAQAVLLALYGLKRSGDMNV